MEKQDRFIGARFAPAAVRLRRPWLPEPRHPIHFCASTPGFTTPLFAIYHLSHVQRSQPGILRFRGFAHSFTGRRCRLDPLDHGDAVQGQPRITGLPVRPIATTDRATSPHCTDREQEETTNGKQFGFDREDESVGDLISLVDRCWLRRSLASEDNVDGLIPR